jgi:hypothetical protein|nr:MAG TPA: hypothetical protein [Podoviridae sp. ctY3D12]
MNNLNQSRKIKVSSALGGIIQLIQLKRFQEWEDW